MIRFTCGICGKSAESDTGRTRKNCDECDTKARRQYYKDRYQKQQDRIRQVAKRRRAKEAEIVRWYRKIGQGLMVVLPPILDHLLPLSIMQEEDMIEIVKAMKGAPKG